MTTKERESKRKRESQRDRERERQRDIRQRGRDIRTNHDALRWQVLRLADKRPLKQKPYICMPGLGMVNGRGIAKKKKSTKKKKTPRQIVQYMYICAHSMK